MITKGARFAAVFAAASALPLTGTAPLSADEFRTPAISSVRVEWRAALEQLRSEIKSRSELASGFAFSGHRRLAGHDPRSRPALVQLNGAISEIFPGIGRSPVPVLLPFDTAAFLEARASGSALNRPDAHYQAGFRTDLFDTGPAGYDAIFSFEPGAAQDVPARIYAKAVEVQITGSILTYDIADPLGSKGEPVKALADQFPDLRRFIREGYLRYAFTRFGVPYVVSIQCADNVPRPRRLACREAYPIAERFLKALKVTGGLPARQPPNMPSVVVDRPTAWSTEFNYRPSGDIIANSGFLKQSGHADFSAYSQIRFPLEKAPAFAHSQSFRHRRPNEDRALTEVTGSIGYQWQDNFCEARSFGVGQCAGGFGHQGQDIAPTQCQPGDAEEHCDPKQQAVVAVRDGMVIRSRGQQAVTLQVNTRTEHVRFRYMHMNPANLDADGILNGRPVQEGERIGVVSNFLDHPNGTSRHLHFDVQVFTRDGWLWVNPYVTLISAYERLLGARGREIGPEPALLPSVANASAPAGNRQQSAGRDN